MVKNKKKKSNVEKINERRVKFSLPETFLLGVFVAAIATSAKAIIDVSVIKDKINTPSARLASMETKLASVGEKMDNLDTKFDSKIDKLYQLMIEGKKWKKKMKTLLQIDCQ